jgi:hypothetical protein
LTAGAPWTVKGAIDLIGSALKADKSNSSGSKAGGSGARLDSSHSHFSALYFSSD